MNKTIATSQIQYHQFLNPQSEVVQNLPQFANESTQLIALYRGMVLARNFDAKCIALQRTGKLGTYASFLGQEAIGIGAPSAMRTEDVLLPSFRESAMLLQRGVTMEELLSYWGGDERRSDFQTPRKDFPICITIGTQVVHAIGVAYAMARQRRFFTRTGRRLLPYRIPRVEFITRAVSIRRNCKNTRDAMAAM